ncbi:hypothetical protein FO519_002744 [Halicephalobus sp. NKZ332]|nr:hypothetical protein FO519_002744 [Halicephalobus sp. NKZ332]
MRQILLVTRLGCWNIRNYGASKESNFPKQKPSVIKLNERTGKQSGNREKKEKKFRLNSLLLLVVPGAAFGLGCWQVQRMKWKLNLIKELESKLEQEAIDFPYNDLDNLNQYEYRRVHLRGRFLFDKEFVIAPRGRFDKDYKQKNTGIAGDSESSSHGGHVITPFVLEKNNLTIMVNRGWLPGPQLHERPVPKPHIGVTEFDAIVRKSENRPQFVSENIPERGVWYYKNFAQMAEYCGASPIYVEATSEFTEPGGPIAGQTNINVRNEHLQYLLTWFSLSAITGVMWFLKFYR